MPDSLRQIIVPGLFVVWSSVIGVATWLTWNPLVRFVNTFDNSAAVWGRTLLGLPLAVIEQAPACGWLAALLYSQWALGGFVDRLLVRHLGTPALGPVACCVLGQGIQGLGVFGLGMLNLLYAPLLVAGVLTIVAVRLLGQRDLLMIGAHFNRLRLRRAKAQGLTTARLLAALLGLVIALALLLALATALHPVWFYDVLAYHFGTPNSWLSEHGMQRNLHDMLSLFVGHNEALFALAMAGGGTMAAQLLNLSNLVLLLAWTREARWLSGCSWRLAGVLWVTTPVVLLSASLSKPDIALMLYGAITCDLTVSGFFARDHKVIWVAGLFAGICLASKYTALGLVWWPIWCLGATLAVIQRRPWFAFRALFLWLSGAMLFLLPWLLRNAGWTGNPFYPAFFEIFGGEAWSTTQAALIDSDAHRRYLADFTPGDIWTLIWGLTFSPWGSLIERFGAFGVLGPVWLWLVPVALWRSRHDPRARWTLLLVAVMWVSWFATTWMARFLLVALPLLGLVIARALGDFMTGKPLLRVFAGLVAALATAANATYVMRETLAHSGGMAAISGNHTPESFLLTMAKRRPIELGTFALLRRLDELPPGRVLLVGDTVHAYVGRRHAHASAFNRPLIATYLTTSEPERSTRELKAAGFVYLLHNPQELARVKNRLGGLALSVEQQTRLEALLASDQVECLAGDCLGESPGLFRLR